MATSAKDKQLQAATRFMVAPEKVEARQNNTLLGRVFNEVRPASDIPLDRIVASPYQQRNGIDEKHIEGLKSTIASGGLISPIVVREVPNPKVSFNYTSSESAESLAPQALYEIVAGHNRVEAFRSLGRDRIPAIVRVMSDADAARALMVDNTHHKELSDWEIFKHLRMIEANGFAKNKTDLADLLGKNRTQVPQYEAFGVLPEDVQAQLEVDPSLLGANAVYKLRDLSVSHPKLVSRAVQLMIKGRLNQSSIADWIKRQTAEAPGRAALPERYKIRERDDMRVVANDKEIRVIGRIDAKKLHALIEAHFEDLIIGADEE